MTTLTAAQAVGPIAQSTNIDAIASLHAAQQVPNVAPAARGGAPAIATSVQFVPDVAPWACAGSLGPVTAAPASRTLAIAAEVRTLVATA